MVWPPSWRRAQLQPLACSAIFHMNDPIRGSSPLLDLDKSILTLSSSTGREYLLRCFCQAAAISMFPAALLLRCVCVCALATKHVQDSPVSLFTRWAKGRSFTSVCTDWQVGQLKQVVLSQKGHLFLVLFFPRLPVFWKLQKIIYPLSLYFPIKHSRLCKMQLYSLHINVNRDRITNFSNTSQTSHTVSVSPTPIVFLEAISLQTLEL